jgi:catechol 2,3-dioxygenase-like lactoylglutathione lyase family enzyme
MIRAVVHTALLVRDYDEAKRFYCEKLGFEVVEDTPLAEGKRWVRIRPAGKQGSDLLLSRAVDQKQRLAVGNQTGGRVLFFLHTDDFASDYQTMRTNGVEFVEGPRDESYGTVSVFKDLYGNRIDLIQPKLGNSPKQVLSEWVRLMNTHEPEALADLYDDNATNLQVAVGKPLVGRQAILQDFRIFFSNIPDSFTKAENMFEDGEWAILEWFGGGAFKTTGKIFSLRGCGFFRLPVFRLTDSCAAILLPSYLLDTTLSARERQPHGI